MTNSFNEEAEQLTVTVVDSADHNLPAEASAMLSALCSRSMEGPQANLAKVKEQGPDRFMKQIYLGYGHSSVAKQGTTKVFLSGLSMIAINHLQNLNPLYKGQESSTRYISFSAENAVIPEELNQDNCTYDVATEIIAKLMGAYESFLPKVVNALKENLVKPVDISDVKWMRTLQPRAFDICRSLLPSGLKTVGVWDGTLEEFRQIIAVLANHENQEVVAVAKAIHSALIKRYPSSFTPEDVTASSWMRKHSASNDENEGYLSPGVYANTSGLDVMGLDDYTRKNALWERPKYGRLPDSIGSYGRINFEYSIDFGGFRDLNRHRKGNINRGYMVPGYFHDWYTDEFANCGLADELFVLMDELTELYNYLTNTVGVSKTSLEYLLPMGTMVNVEASYPIDNAVYVAELRSGTTVHPTVRRVAIGMAKELKIFCNFPIYANMDGTDKLDVRRANQTIHMK